MALTFHARATLAADQTFINRCRQAAVKYALYIAGNPATTAPNVRLLKQVLAAPDTFARLFAIAAAQNDFAGDGSASDCAPDTPAGDAAMSSVVEGTIWPAFAREVAP
jgi:hypothetical protein